MKYFIKTFGCQQNKADSERVAATFKARGIQEAQNYEEANYVVINTCMVRESAENRVYGLVHNLAELKQKKINQNEFFKIIVTGCMVGVAFRDKTGKYLQKIRTVMPDVDEFMPVEEVGFDNEPVRQNQTHAWVPISNGCNNFCTFCIVPFTRGREISRPYNDIIAECLKLKQQGYKSVMLLGQNVNSYGADLIIGEKNIQVMRDLDKTYFEDSKLIEPKPGVVNQGHPKQRAEDFVPRALAENDKRQAPIFSINGSKIKPIFVKHLGRYRIPTLFPHLLEEVAQMGFEKVEFMSSNPWDFSDELIDVIARNSNISRTIHLPIQSGDNDVLKRMNRWYTREQYMELVKKLRLKIKDLRLTTDIIVGFCGETDEEFNNTYDLAKQVGFDWAYLAQYSSRPMTAATTVFKDDITPQIKKARWEKLDALINKPHLLKHN